MPICETRIATQSQGEWRVITIPNLTDYHAIVEGYLQRGKANKVYKLLVSDAISEMKVWLAVFFKLRDHCLEGQALKGSEILEKEWCNLWSYAQSKPWFEKIKHSLAFSFLSIGNIYMNDFGMSDEAMKIAVKTQNLLLLKSCR